MKLKCKMIFTEIENEIVCMPMRETDTEFNGMIKMNETAKDVVELMENEISIDELTAKMLEKYDVDESTLRDDIQKVVNALASKGLIDY